MLHLICWCGNDGHFEDFASAAIAGWTKDEQGEACPACSAGIQERRHTRQLAHSFIASFLA